MVEMKLFKFILVFFFFTELLEDLIKIAKHKFKHCKHPMLSKI